MSCAMKLQLASEYEAATVVFSKAAAEVQRNIGTSSKETYEDLGRIETDARLRSELARLALEKHTAEHRC